MSDRANFGKKIIAKRHHAVSPVKLYNALAEEIGTNIKTGAPNISGDIPEKPALSPSQKKLVKRRLSDMMDENLIEHPIPNTPYYALTTAKVSPSQPASSKRKPRLKKTTQKRGKSKKPSSRRMTTATKVKE